jgi:hypothetical protein
MTYTGSAGSYYEFTPGQVYLDPRYNNGMYHSYKGMSGCGSSCGCSMGAVDFDFNANKVWADVQLGGSCYTPNNPNYQNEAMYGQCNAAGARATDTIRKGLNALGYGPLVLGEMWSNANPGDALAKFHADEGLAPGPGLGVSKAGLQRMEERLGGAKAGVGGIVVFGLAALAVGGGLVLISKMRKK